MAFRTTPLQFVSERKDKLLSACDYIFYEFTPEEAQKIDTALHFKEQYRFYSTWYFKHQSDEWSRKNALIAQFDYLNALEALKEDEE